MNNGVRAIEVFLLRMACASSSPLGAVENFEPGKGVLTAYDLDGRQYTIKIEAVEAQGNAA
jgi:hypothetical protein